jgi:hypothetical protein
MSREFPVDSLPSLSSSALTRLGIGVAARVPIPYSSKTYNHPNSISVVNKKTLIINMQSPLTQMTRTFCNTYRNRYPAVMVCKLGCNKYIAYSCTFCLPCPQLAISIPTTVNTSQTEAQISLWAMRTSLSTSLLTKLSAYIPENLPNEFATISSTDGQKL